MEFGAPNLERVRHQPEVRVVGIWLDGVTHTLHEFEHAWVLCQHQYCWATSASRSTLARGVWLSGASAWPANTTIDSGAKSGAR